MAENNDVFRMLAIEDKLDESKLDGKDAYAHASIVLSIKCYEVITLKF